MIMFLFMLQTDLFYSYCMLFTILKAKNDWNGKVSSNFREYLNIRLLVLLNSFNVPENFRKNLSLPPHLLQIITFHIINN